MKHLSIVVTTAALVGFGLGMYAHAARAPEPPAAPAAAPDNRSAKLLQQLQAAPWHFAGFTDRADPAKGIIVETGSGLILANVRVARDAAVTIGGKPAPLSDLVLRMPLQLQLEGAEPVITRLDAHPRVPPRLVIRALDARKRTLTLLDEETQTTLHDVPLSANVVVEFHVIPQRPAGLRPGTRVTPPHRVPGTFDELKPGMRLFFMTLRFVDGQATIRHLVVDRVEEVKDTKP